jgi:hypothetical protein
LILKVLKWEAAEVIQRAISTNIGWKMNKAMNIDRYKTYKTNKTLGRTPFRIDGPIYRRKRRNFVAFVG